MTEECTSRTSDEEIKDSRQVAKRLEELAIEMLTLSKVLGQDVQVVRDEQEGAGE